jgi:hypothetical protein
MNLGSNPVELDLSRNSWSLGSFVFCVAVLPASEIGKNPGISIRLFILHLQGK